MISKMSKRKVARLLHERNDELGMEMIMGRLGADLAPGPQLDDAVAALGGRKITARTFTRGGVDYTINDGWLICIGASTAADVQATADHLMREYVKAGESAIEPFSMPDLAAKLLGYEPSKR